MQLLAVSEEPGKAELKAQFIELRAKGYSYAKIAKRRAPVSPLLALEQTQSLQETLARFLKTQANLPAVRH